MLEIFAKSDKNRNRELPSFANINLMGKCNLKCFFCIGNELKQISEKVGKSISGISQIGEHFSKWKNFLPFLNQTKEMGIKKLYLTTNYYDKTFFQAMNC